MRNNSQNDILKLCSEIHKCNSSNLSELKGSSNKAQL
uniref:Uncharacterized protein n=1 Tax=Scinaia undulata TaxID=1884664 RepID=A0A1G4NXI1_9FLOR|nr:Hypothetical protein ORF_20 [Scinaia undulata]SCW23314.1 Hypothetical protein ORF_20 [Scinaia undulata]